MINLTFITAGLIDNFFHFSSISEPISNMCLVDVY